MWVSVGSKSNEIYCSNEKEYSNDSQIIMYEFQSEKSRLRKYLWHVSLYINPKHL